MLLYSPLSNHAAQSLEKHPHINAVFADGMRRQYQRIDIGLAVAGPDGSLSVPVLRDVNKMSPEEIDESRRNLASKARANKLRPDDFGGAAITLSNIGQYRSIQLAVPVIPCGQGAILVTGAIYEKPGANDKAMRLPMSFAFDHRVNNGAPAAAFLQTLIDNIEAS